MQITMKLISSFLLLSVFLLVLSCSKSDEDTVDHKYVGTWERTWFDSEVQLNYKQTLVLGKSTFSSTINIVQDGSELPYIEFNGTQVVIDNTLEASITKIGLADENNNFSYTLDSGSNFDNVVYGNLKIHSNFIGTYFLDSGELTLRLDLDGDGSVRGDEGLFVYQSK